MGQGGVGWGVVEWGGTGLDEVGWNEVKWCKEDLIWDAEKGHRGQEKRLRDGEDRKIKTKRTDYNHYFLLHDMALLLCAHVCQ